MARRPSAGTDCPPTSYARFRWHSRPLTARTGLRAPLRSRRSLRRGGAVPGPGQHRHSAPQGPRAGLASPQLACGRGARPHRRQALAALQSTRGLATEPHDRGAAQPGTPALGPVPVGRRATGSPCGMRFAGPVRGNTALRTPGTAAAQYPGEPSYPERRGAGERVPGADFFLDSGQAIVQLRKTVTETGGDDVMVNFR